MVAGCIGTSGSLMLSTWVLIASPSESHRPVFPWNSNTEIWGYVRDRKGGDNLRAIRLTEHRQSTGGCKSVQEVKRTNAAWSTEERVRIPAWQRPQTVRQTSLFHETFFPLAG